MRIVMSNLSLMSIGGRAHIDIDRGGKRRASEEHSRCIHPARMLGNPTLSARCTGKKPPSAASTRPEYPCEE
jgi:hypothetical protein